MLKRASLTLLALLVVSGIIVAAISFSPACVNEATQQNAANDEHSQDHNAYSERIFVSLECGAATFGCWIIDHLNEISTVITALATVAIGIFTWTLWRATTEQGRLTQQSIALTKQSIELAHAEFIASHRPQFKIYFFRLSHLILVVVLMPCRSRRNSK